MVGKIKTHVDLSAEWQRVGRKAIRRYLMSDPGDNRIFAIG